MGWNKKGVFFIVLPKLGANYWLLPKLPLWGTEARVTKAVHGRRGYLITSKFFCFCHFFFPVLVTSRSKHLLSCMPGVFNERYEGSAWAKLKAKCLSVQKKKSWTFFSGRSKYLIKSRLLSSIRIFKEPLPTPPLAGQQHPRRTEQN
jgi:hypothetical protein